MSAEGNLYNPAVFEPLSGDKGARYFQSLPSNLQDALNAVQPSADLAHTSAGYHSTLWMARRYLAIVKNLKTRTSYSAIKSHIFKLCHALFEHERFFPVRNALGGVGGREWDDRMQSFSAVLDQLEALLEVSALPVPRSSMLPQTRTLILTFGPALACAVLFVRSRSRSSCSAVKALCCQSPLAVWKLPSSTSLYTFCSQSCGL